MLYFIRAGIYLLFICLASRTVPENSICVINSCWVNEHVLHFVSFFGSLLFLPFHWLSLLLTHLSPWSLNFGICYSSVVCFLLFLHPLPSHLFWCYGLKYSIYMNDSQIYMFCLRLYVQLSTWYLHLGSLLASHI